MQFHTIIDGRHMQKEISNAAFDKTAQVVVVGLGTAGSIAFIKAAELKLDVIGIEKLSGMGGTGTMGCVWDYFYGSSGGRFEDINRKNFELTEKAFIHSEPPSDSKDFRCYNGSARCVVLDEEIKKSGGRLMYETTVIGVYTEGRKIKGIKCVSPGGIFTIGAEVFLDCSGDISLCRLAGLEYKTGRDYDGRCMRFSKTLVAIKDGLARGGWTMKGNRENKSDLELSNLILKCNSMTPFLEENYTEDYRFVYEGTILGLRESPRICAKTELKFSDVLFGKKTQKPVFYTFAPIDNVNRDAAFNSETQQLWRMVCKMYGVGLSIGVPLETLLPKECDNVIVAGKGTGTDCDLAAGIRMRKDLEKCGEAAATAAYLSVKENTDISKVDYETLSAMLRESGCLDEANNIGIAAISGGMHREKLNVPKTLEEIKENLTTEYFGLSVLEVIKNNSEEVREMLRECLASDNSILRERAAFAGGAIGLGEALPVLIEMTKRRPDFIPKRPAFCSVISGAVYLLRKFDSEEARQRLREIAEEYAYATEYDEYTSSRETEMAYLLKNLAVIGLEQMKKQERGK